MSASLRSQNTDRSYSVEELLAYRKSECEETKKHIRNIKFFKSPVRRTKRRAQQSNDKRNVYTVEYLRTFQTATHCQIPPKRAQYPGITFKASNRQRNASRKGKNDISRKESETKKNELSAFGPNAGNAEESPQEYPGKMFFDKAGIDITGKTNEELFELEKHLRTGSKGSETPALSTPEVKKKETKEPEKPLEELTQFLTADDLFDSVTSPTTLSNVEKADEPSWMSNLRGSVNSAPFSDDRTSLENTSDLTFSSDLLIPPFESLSLSPSNGRSILASILADEPEPDPEPEPEKDLIDEETVARGTEMGVKLLDLFKQEMESSGPSSQSVASMQKFLPGYSMPQHLPNGVNPRMPPQRNSNYFNHGNTMNSPMHQPSYPHNGSESQHLQHQMNTAQQLGLQQTNPYGRTQENMHGYPSQPKHDNSKNHETADNRVNMMQYYSDQGPAQGSQNHQHQHQQHHSMNNFQRGVPPFNPFTQQGGMMNSQHPQMRTPMQMAPPMQQGVNSAMYMPQMMNNYGPRGFPPMQRGPAMDHSSFRYHSQPNVHPYPQGHQMNQYPNMPQNRPQQYSNEMRQSIPPAQLFSSMNS